MLALLGVIAFIIGAAFFIGTALIWYYSAQAEYRDPFSVLCPETLQPAEIMVDGRLAAQTRFQGREELRVSGCSRWPEREGCDQACTPEVPLLGDSRTRQQIAAFGLQPHQLRIFNPVRMTRELYDKVMALTAAQHR